MRSLKQLPGQQNVTFAHRYSDIRDMLHITTSSLSSSWASYGEWLAVFELQSAFFRNGAITLLTYTY